TRPCRGDVLQMHYVGTFAADGRKFDSSRDAGAPLTFQIGVGQVIRGWDEGVLLMELGEKAKLEISSDFGYGRQGAGNVIPPNADLIFVVELVAINGLKAPQDDTLMYGAGLMCLSFIALKICGCM
ncbi:unnamed protein product, partial [Polarella glacialis]